MTRPAVTCEACGEVAAHRCAKCSASICPRDARRWQPPADGGLPPPRPKVLCPSCARVERWAMTAVVLFVALFTVGLLGLFAWCAP